MRDRVLRACADLACHRPKTVLVTAVLLAALSAAAATVWLEMDANTDHLIDPDRPYMRDYQAFLDDFGDLESLVVVLEDNGDEAAMEKAVDALADELGQIPDLLAVHHAILPREQRRISARAMTDEELADIARLREAFPAWLAQDDGTTALATAIHQLRRLNGSLLSREEQETLGAAAFATLNLFAWPDETNDFEDLLRPLPTEYFRSKSGRFWFIEIMPEKDYGSLAVIDRPLAAIREVLRRFRRDHPDISAGLTGKPVLQADEMRTTNDDMSRASIIAIILVGLLFMVMVRGWLRPALAMVALLIAIAWTFGWTTLVVGRLNLLSIVFTLILVGIGVDFGVHVLVRFQEERRNKGLSLAMRSALLTSGRGNISGAITSSVAFFMTFFTDFRGLQELGIVAGSGLILCLVAMLLVFPALLALVDAKFPVAQPPAAGRLDRVLRGFDAFNRRRPLLVLGVVLALTLAFLPQAAHMGFDGNVLELQATGLDSVRWERRVLEDDASASWFAAIITTSEEELAKKIAATKGRPAIGQVTSLFDVVRPTSLRREALFDQLRAVVPTVAASPPPPAWNPATLESAVDILKSMAKKAALVSPDDVKALRDLGRRLLHRAAVLKREPMGRAQVVQRVERARNTVKLMLEGLRAPLREALPKALRARLVSPSGHYLLSLFPRENIWDEIPMEHFVSAVRKIDPKATGVPITHYSSIQDMRRGFVTAALLAALGVLVIVFLDFRKLGPTLAAILPVSLAFLWLTSLMGWAGVDFNLANFFGVPILIGIGVDGGIHLVHRYREGGGFGATRRAILLTNLTTLIGFGCLLLASHRGLRSLGLIMALGCAACLVATLMVLPPALYATRRKD